MGHGTADSQAFVDLLRGAEVGAVVDVRRFPGSRRHPQFSRSALEGTLPGAGIGYRWDEALGGRRHAVPGSPHVALRNAAFRAYADYMETPEFANGLGRLLDETRERPTAILCAESLWWKCHRRLIADAALLLHGVPVTHILQTGKVTAHEPTDGVRVQGHRLVYDGGQTPLL